jgi:phosphoglycolate phosphatase
VTLRTRAVVFDLDGTLVDSSRDLATGVNAALRRVAPGTPPLSDEAVRGFVGSGARKLVGRSLAARGLSLTVEEVLPVFIEEYRRVLLATTRLYPGVVEALDGLAGRKLAVLTNKPGDMSRAILEGLGVASRFFRIAGAGDVAARKPDPGGLLHLLEEAGAAPAEAVFVGDSAVDVQTGRAARVFTIGVTYGFDAAGFLEHPPDARAQRIGDVPRLIDVRDAVPVAGGAPPA